MINNSEKVEVTYPTYSTPFENQSVYNMRSCNKPFDNSITPTIGTYTTSTIPAQSVDLSTGLYNDKIIDYTKNRDQDGYKEEPAYKEFGNVVQDVQQDQKNETFVESTSPQVNQEYTEVRKVSALSVIMNNLKSYFMKFEKDLSNIHALKIHKKINDLEKKIKDKKISVIDLKEKCNEIKDEIQEKMHRVSSEKFTDGSKTLKIVTLIIFIIIICLGGWLLFKSFTSQTPVSLKPTYTVNDASLLHDSEDYKDIKTFGGSDDIKIVKFSDFMKEMKKDKCCECNCSDNCICDKKDDECDNEIKDEDSVDESSEDEEEIDDTNEDPLKTDANYTVDMNNISLNGGSRLDNKIKI